MFAFLRGQIARKGVDTIDLDVNGVGYEVHVPAAVQRHLMVDSAATLLTYCHIREDAFTVFGFLRDEERILFKMLLGVTKVGPKVALAVLSGLSVAQFRRAVLENDVKALTKVNGVGTKMAQRIVLELKAKMGQDAELDAILGESEEVLLEESDDVMAALIALGCTQNEAARACKGARQKLGDDARDEELVREALRSLAK